MTSPIPSPYYSIVLPPAKDPAHIEAIIAGICEVLDAAIPERYEVIVIEREEEGILQIAEALRPIYKNLQVAACSGPIIAQGWELANGDILGILDGNLLAKPTSLSEITKTIDGGADLAITSQYAKHDANADPAVGCFAIRRNCLTRLHCSPKGCQLLIEMIGQDNFDSIMAQNSKTTWQHFAEVLKHLLGK